MPYNPQKHIPINKPVSPDQAIPTDGRSMFYDETLNKYRPYQSKQEVIDYLIVAKTREGRFSIFINTTGVLQPNGNFLGGTVDIYWFRDGFTLADLVLMFPASTGGSNYKRYPFIIASQVNFLQNAEWINAEFSSGTRNNGEVFLSTETGDSDDSIFVFDPSAGRMTPVNGQPIPVGDRLRFTFKLAIS